MIPVSLCLTTCNRATVLPATVDSLLSQTFSDFELIISDDCSTDHTEEICRDYQARDPRIRYFRNNRNLKMPGNLNAAIGRATGEYIANLHDGDVYRADLIEKWKNALDACPTAAFVFNAYHTLQQDGSHRLYDMPFGTRVPGEEIALHYFRTVTSCVWGTVMARASAYARAGGFDPSFGFISDVDMWLRLAHDADVAYVPEPLIFITPREADHPYRYTSWRHAFWSLGIYTRHLKAYRDTLPDAVTRFTKGYPYRLRTYVLWSMLSLMRHRQWGRLREGMAILQDSTDPVLQRLGSLCGNQRWLPDGYGPEWWTMASLPAMSTGTDRR